MVDHLRKIHVTMLAGWGLIGVVLFISYLGEVLKGQRTIGYFAAFMAVTLLPLLFCAWLHRTGRLQKQYPAIMVGCYFLMYTFVILTGSTSMVFSYILPMLSFMVLFHQPSLVLWTGLASLVVNLVSIVCRFNAGEITLANSKDVEIQLALIVLCFIGAWVSSRIYDRITRDNEAYLNQVLRQSEQINTQKGKMQEMQSDIDQISVQIATDPLTGIGSRYAFNDCLARLEKTFPLGVIFCDTNGLKYRNDTEGHAAGDRLLVDFTKDLTSFFRRSDCFRISGDEFVVLMPGITKSAFQSRVDVFYRSISTRAVPPAAIGWSYGSDPLSTIRAAENHMYDDKKIFYRNHPEYRR